MIDLLESNYVHLGILTVPWGIELLCRLAQNCIYDELILSRRNSCIYLRTLCLWTGLICSHGRIIMEFEIRDSSEVICFSQSFKKSIIWASEVKGLTKFENEIGSWRFTSPSGCRWVSYDGADNGTLLNELEEQFLNQLLQHKSSQSWGSLKKKLKNKTSDDWKPFLRDSGRIGLQRVMGLPW